MAFSTDCFSTSWGKSQIPHVDNCMRAAQNCSTWVYYRSRRGSLALRLSQQRQKLPCLSTLPETRPPEEYVCIPVIRHNYLLDIFGGSIMSFVFNGPRVVDHVTATRSIAGEKQSVEIR